MLKKDQDSTTVFQTQMTVVFSKNQDRSFLIFFSLLKSQQSNEFKEKGQASFLDWTQMTAGFNKNQDRTCFGLVFFTKQITAPPQLSKG